jgi:hypothetical protein
MIHDLAADVPNGDLPISYTGSFGAYFDNLKAAVMMLKVPHELINQINDVCYVYLSDAGIFGS